MISTLRTFNIAKLASCVVAWAVSFFALAARGVLGVAIAIAFTGCSEVSAMGKVVLFSPVSGVVLSQGKPVAGAVLKRQAQWRWGNKTYDDTVTTDAQGRFSFAELNGTMLLGSVLPHEPYVEQSITIEHDGKSYIAWRTVKRGYSRNDELSYLDRTNIDNPAGGGGMRTLADPSKPIVVTCSLEAPREKMGDISGICRFAGGAGR